MDDRARGQLPPSLQQAPSAGGGGGEEDVVDRGPVGVAHRLEGGEVGSQQGDGSLPADHPREAGARRRTHRQQGAVGRHLGPYPPPQSPRVGEDAHPSTHAGQAAAEVVHQELEVGRCRAGRPGGGTGGGGGGFVLEEAGDGGHGGHSVGDGVVDPHVETPAPRGEAGEEPHLPQRAREIEGPAAQSLDGGEEGRLVPRGRHHLLANVAGEGEFGVVDPVGRAQPPPGGEQALAEAGGEGESGVDHPPEGP